MNENRITKTELSLNPERDALTVKYHGPQPYALTMTTGAVEEVIANYGAARTAMLPPVAEAWTPSTTVEATRDPAWLIETDAFAGDVLVHVRDVRFGWLHYIFTKDRARALGAALVQKADTPAPVAGRA